MEPGSSAGAGWAAVKLAAGFGLPPMIAAVLGLLILPPRTMKEFVVRICATVISSFIFGPLLAVLVLAWMPEVMESADWAAGLSGIDFPQLALFYVLAPCMLIAGLPSWWVLGAYMRWTSRLHEEDAMDWLNDALKTFRGDR